MGSTPPSGAGSRPGRAGLLAAALAEIEEQGTSLVSLRSIARRAGVSHAAPAAHFTDKAGLLRALAEWGFQQLGDALQRRAAALGPGATAIETLGALGSGYVAFAVDNPTLFELMWRPDLALEVDGADPPGTELLAMLEAVTARAIEEGWGAGPAERAAFLLWSTVHGLATLALAQWFDVPRVPPPPTPDEVIALLLALTRR